MSFISSTYSLIFFLSLSFPSPSNSQTEPKCRYVLSRLNLGEHVVMHEHASSSHNVNL